MIKRFSVIMMLWKSPSLFREYKTETIMYRKQILVQNLAVILDEWRHLGTDLQLTLNEISYLKRCSIPHRKNETILAENKTLIIQELLQEHEVMFIQID